MNVVIFGCGWQGLRHVKALDELNINLECIVDINPKGVHNSLPDFPKDNVYKDADLCFKNHKPDVAIIATNSSSRLSCIKKCVEYGIKKIFCEKPMATNLNDADEMIRITEQNGCILAVNHLRRWSPNHLRLKAMLDNDAIGTIEHIYFQSGSTGLGNVGTHIVDNIRFYTGSEIDWVIGFLDETGTPNPRGSHYVDPGGWGMMMLKDGTRVFIDTCEDTGVPHVFEIVGTYGRVVIEEMNNHWQVLARSEKGRNLSLTKYPTPIEDVQLFNPVPWDVKEFTKIGLKELIFDEGTSCTGIDGLRAIEGIIAIHMSHQNDGRKVFLPLSQDLHGLDVPWA